MYNSISSKMIVRPSSVIVAIVLVVAVFLALASIEESVVSAQLVDIDEPPTNATEELDVKIDATVPLPANGTVVVDITNADDIDIDAIPPEGVSIIVTNTTLTVTNSSVEMAEGEGNGTPSSDTSDSADNNGDEEEGSDNGDEEEGSDNGDEEE